MSSRTHPWWQVDSLSERAELTLLIVSAVVLISVFVVFVLSSLPVLTYAHGLNYVEGLLVDQARRVWEEPGLYPPFETPPYVMDNYGPVYPVLASVIPCPESSVFFAGRLISIMSTLVSAGLIVLIVRRYSGDAPGLLCASLFLLSPEVNRFAVVMRVDALALALGLAGFYMILTPGRWWRLAGCVAFFLCIYTRHSMVAFPIVGCLMLWARDGRRALPWLAGLLTAGISAFVIGDQLTGGRMHLHLIEFNLLNYRWNATVAKWFGTQWPGRLTLVVAAYLALNPPTRGSSLNRDLSWRRWVYGMLCVIGCFCLFAQAYQFYGAHVGASSQASFLGRLSGAPPQVFVELTYLVTFHALLAGVALLAMIKWFFREARVPAEGRPEDLEGAKGLMVLVGLPSAALIGRVGSDVNYLIEMIVLLILVCGMALSRGSLLRRGVVLVFLVAYGIVGASSLQYRDANPEFLEEHAHASQRILDYLEKVPGPILSEDPSFPAILGRPLEYQPFMYRQITDSRDWDPAPLIRDIRDHRFVAVVRRAVYPYSGFTNGKPDFAGGVWLRTSGFSKEIQDVLLECYAPDRDSKTVERMTDLYFRGTAVWMPRQ